MRSGNVQAIDHSGPHHAGPGDEYDIELREIGRQHGHHGIGLDGEVGEPDGCRGIEVEVEMEGDRVRRRLPCRVVHAQQRRLGVGDRLGVGPATGLGRHVEKLRIEQRNPGHTAAPTIEVGEEERQVVGRRDARKAAESCRHTVDAPNAEARERLSDPFADRGRRGGRGRGHATISSADPARESRRRRSQAACRAWPHPTACPRC